MIVTIVKVMMVRPCWSAFFAKLVISVVRVRDLVESMTWLCLSFRSTRKFNCNTS
jgi:hypothetical protein